MKKETMAEKLAKKFFESGAVQKSWQKHLQAFGPILEPAFADNLQARIHLIAALNHINRCKVKAGVKKLQLIEKSCETNADKAAWLFCMGLAMEMANMKEEMVSFYQSAGKYGHSFYLPYLQVAKAAHGDAVFEIAEENYLQAIQCLQSEQWNEQKKVNLGFVYMNYASCLTMMHRYEDAGEALEHSCEALPRLFGRMPVQAILEAAKGNAENARALLEKMKEREFPLYATTNKMVSEILNHKHPHFSIVALPEGRTAKFWDWFCSLETQFLKNLKEEDYASVFQIIQPKLKEMFPFMERNLEFAVEPKENGYQITFADFFMISLAHAYRELIETVPASLAERWSFDVAH